MYMNDKWQFISLWMGSSLFKNPHSTPKFNDLSNLFRHSQLYFIFPSNLHGYNISTLCIKSHLLSLISNNVIMIVVTIAPLSVRGPDVAAAVEWQLSTAPGSPRVSATGARPSASLRPGSVMTQHTGKIGLDCETGNSLNICHPHTLPRLYAGNLCHYVSCVQ